MTEPGDGRNDVSLRLLEIFAAMVRCGTTVSTAEALGISQPAVSAGLRQLETRLGLTLFERTGRHLEPTQEARDLFEEIRPLFGIMRAFSMRARDLRLGRAGRLRIVATPPIGYSVGPEALRRFLEGRAAATVSYDVRRLDQVMDAVQTGEADLGLALSSERMTALHMDLLQRAAMAVLLPARHPLAAKTHVTPEDMEGVPLIGIDLASELGRPVARAFESTGIPYEPRIEVRYCQTASALVAEGLGVAVVDPWSAAPYLTRGLVTRPFLPACETRSVALTRRGVPHSGLLLSFLAELRAVMERFELAAPVA